MSGCPWPRPYPSDHRRALRSGSAAPLAKSQEGENEHNHNDQANEINQTIHRRLHAGSTNGNATLWPQIGSFSSWFCPVTVARFLREDPRGPTSPAATASIRVRLAVARTGA